MEDSTQLGLLIQAQQKMADDVSDIKVMVKEAAQIIHFVRRDQDEMKLRVDKLEGIHADCPARLKANAWSISLKDIAWIVALFGGIVAMYASIKK